MLRSADKIVIVIQKTALEELLERFNTVEQTRFYIEHLGGSFEEYQAADTIYHNSLLQLKQYLPKGVRSQVIERSFLPNFLFGDLDIVVTLGRDGLVVNTAKYLNHQPLVGFNPDPSRIDGVLLPFQVSQAAGILPKVVTYRFAAKEITMARALLNDGQQIHAVNDLFIGQKTHTSARYRLQLGDCVEDQSSSGIIISTGAGSTGWFRSVLAGAVGIVQAKTGNHKLAHLRDLYAFDSASNHLCFSVREPFISKTSNADLVFGRIDGGQELIVTSQMPRNGVIFGDGIESDFLEFNSGSVARIGVSERKVKLVVG